MGFWLVGMVVCLGRERALVVELARGTICPGGVGRVYEGLQEKGQDNASR